VLVDKPLAISWRTLNAGRGLPPRAMLALITAPATRSNQTVLAASRPIDGSEIGPPQMALNLNYTRFSSYRPRRPRSWTQNAAAASCSPQPSTQIDPDPLLMGRARPPM